MRETFESQYNIPDSILREAAKLKLDAMGTGGNIDYVYKTIGKNADGSERIAVIQAKDDVGSPEHLTSPAYMTIWLDEGPADIISIPFKTTLEAMKKLSKIIPDRYAGS